MKLKPEDKPTIIFRTEWGDYDVSLFSSEGKKQYFLAQKATEDLKELMAQSEIKKVAINTLHSSLVKNECTPGCQINDEDGTQTKENKIED